MRHIGRLIKSSVSCRPLLLQVCGRMYLECIFAAPDIQRQLPHEGKAFAQVDKHFRETMRRTHDRPSALLAVTTPGGDVAGGLHCLCMPVQELAHVGT